MEQIKIIWELPPWLTNPDNLQALIQKEVNIIKDMLRSWRDLTISNDG